MEIAYIFAYIFSVFRTEVTMSLFLKFILLGIILGSVVEAEDGKTVVKDKLTCTNYTRIALHFNFYHIFNIQCSDKAPTCETNEDCPKGRVCRVGHCFKGICNLNYCKKTHLISICTMYCIVL